MAITIRDVAKAAKVSETAVSAVMGRPGRCCTVRVGESTRRRIVAAAKRLAYSPNIVASGLRTGKTFTVGVILEATGVEVHMRKSQALEDMAYANGYRLFVCHHRFELERMEAYIRDLLARRVDGLIVDPIFTAKCNTLRRLAESHFPLVFFPGGPSFEADRAQVDNVHGGYLGARHMIEIGRTRMAFFYGRTFYPSIQGRLNGWRIACEEAGLDFEGMTFMETSETPYPDTAYQMCRSLMSSGHAIDAVVATNDLLALGVLKAMQDTGINVPGNVAVMGFDDNHFSGFLPIPLTTIRQPAKELGEAAFRLLLRRMEDPGAPFETVSLKPSLVVRQSTMVAKK